MAFKNRKGQVTHIFKKYKDNVEIKPCKFYSSNGSSVITGAVDGEVILDKHGKPIPWGQIDFVN